MAAKETGGTHEDRHDWWRPVLLVDPVLLILVLVRIFGIGERLGALRSWIEGLGSWGPVAFFFLYAAAVVAAIPGSALSVAAGGPFGSVIVALTRLAPLFPFNLLNYGFGLTRIPFWTYVFWSYLCMLPGTILYVVGADAFTEGLAQGRGPG